MVAVLQHSAGTEAVGLALDCEYATSEPPTEKVLLRGLRAQPEHPHGIVRQALTRRCRPPSIVTKVPPRSCKTLEKLTSGDPKLRSPCRSRKTSPSYEAIDAPWATACNQDVEENEAVEHRRARCQDERRSVCWAARQQTIDELVRRLIWINADLRDRNLMVSVSRSNTFNE